jgi:hypothetical protein
MMEVFALHSFELCCPEVSEWGKEAHLTLCSALKLDSPGDTNESKEPFITSFALRHGKAVVKD